LLLPRHRKAAAKVALSRCCHRCSLRAADTALPPLRCAPPPRFALPPPPLTLPCYVSYSFYDTLVLNSVLTFVTNNCDKNKN
jgi:hypothetical protein